MLQASVMSQKTWSDLEMLGVFSSNGLWLLFNISSANGTLQFKSPDWLFKLSIENNQKHYQKADQSYFEQ